MTSRHFIIPYLLTMLIDLECLVNVTWHPLLHPHFFSFLSLIKKLISKFTFFLLLADDCWTSELIRIWFNESNSAERGSERKNEKKKEINFLLVYLFGMLLPTVQWTIWDGWGSVKISIHAHIRAFRLSEIVKMISIFLSERIFLSLEHSYRHHRLRHPTNAVDFDSIPLVSLFSEMVNGDGVPVCWWNWNRRCENVFKFTWNFYRYFHLHSSFPHHFSLFSLLFCEPWQSRWDPCRFIIYIDEREGRPITKWRILSSFSIFNFSPSLSSPLLAFVMFALLLSFHLNCWSRSCR